MAQWICRILGVIGVILLLIGCTKQSKYYPSGRDTLLSYHNGRYQLSSVSVTEFVDDPTVMESYVFIDEETGNYRNSSDPMMPWEIIKWKATRKKLYMIDAPWRFCRPPESPPTIEKFKEDYLKKHPDLDPQKVKLIISDKEQVFAIPVYYRIFDVSTCEMHGSYDITKFTKEEQQIFNSLMRKQKVTFLKYLRAEIFHTESW